MEVTDWNPGIPADLGVWNERQTETAVVVVFLARFLSHTNTKTVAITVTALLDDRTAKH